jgi:hypothetical protein
MQQRFTIGSVGAVIAAIGLASAHVATQGAQGRQDQGSSVATTPHGRDGHPDFSGIWVPTRGRGEALPAGFDATTGNFNPVLRSRTTNPVDFERDAGIRQRIFPREGRPWYKPQYWDRVQFNDVHGHSLLAPDPAFQCMPEGVPRMGLPQEIVHTGKQMIFLYPLHVRRIYLDGRPQPPEEQWIGTWFGHSVGRWEGETLVIDTIDFNGLEWLGWPGWFTSPDKRVTERIRRNGNTLTWQATVEDSVLLRPWTTAEQTRQLNTNPQAEIEEALPCVEKDLGHMATRERG